MTKTEEFWNGVAEGYAKRPISDEEAYGVALERTRAYLGPTDRVLEVGAGTGTTARRLAPHTGEILATDISGKLLDIAAERIEADGIGNITLGHHAMDALPEGPFDTVIGFNVLHLMVDLEASLADLAARVRPGGYLITKTPCIARMWYLRPLIGAARLIGKAPYVRFLKADEMDRLVNAMDHLWSQCALNRAENSA